MKSQLRIDEAADGGLLVQYVNFTTGRKTSFITKSVKMGDVVPMVMQKVKPEEADDEVLS